MNHHLLTLLLLSPAIAGFIYLPWREQREYGVSIGRSGWVAMAAVVVLYGMMWRLDWADPLVAWLDTPASPARHRMLPAAWAVYSLPLWAACIIVCARTARDLGSVSSAIASLPLRGVRAFGWMLLGVCWSVFLVLAALR
ncbi:hypothetical protein M8A51_22520 [Schlegelella sp. S2-27]|uniref:DUF420 domain-containing protein n=1 Tax=Caldimonas mangrovi TaxID=2944811 RepID=A0ABT0YU79_9BURK|nr:hypothetical protein [Caldimonas mangrovi]MCM5682312.1 hypothetical protein [Caldimonas mangrovi]